MKARLLSILLGVVLVVAILTGGVVLSHQEDGDPISCHSYAKIEIGMGQTAVEKLLGPRCGYADGERFVSMCGGKPHCDGKGPPRQEIVWEGEWTIIAINFCDGQVEHKSMKRKLMGNLMADFKRRLGFQNESTFVTVGE